MKFVPDILVAGGGGGSLDGLAATLMRYLNLTSAAAVSAPEAAAPLTVSDLLEAQETPPGNGPTPARRKPRSRVPPVSQHAGTEAIRSRVCLRCAFLTPKEAASGNIHHQKEQRSSPPRSNVPG